jgi:hypothetical protein
VKRFFASKTLLCGVVLAIAFGWQLAASLLYDGRVLAGALDMPSPARAEEERIHAVLGPHYEALQAMRLYVPPVNGFVLCPNQTEVQRIFHLNALRLLLFPRLVVPWSRDSVAFLKAWTGDKQLFFCAIEANDREPPPGRWNRIATGEYFGLWQFKAPQ